jgi:hypothetical protein
MRDPTGDQMGLMVAAVADHHGWAVVVTVAPDGTVVDRRRAELIDVALPSNPVEHEAQVLPLEDAVALVREVERSVTLHVRALWDALGTNHDIAAAAIREIPQVPSEIAAQIRSYHAQTRADSAMYRRVLADHATQRGWAVHFYDHRRVVDEATTTLGLASEHLATPRVHLGPPWTIDHRRAYAAALLAQHDDQESAGSKMPSNGARRACTSRESPSTSRPSSTETSTRSS